MTTPDVSLLTRDAVRQLLIVMFEGWRLHEASWEGDDLRVYGRDDTDCMIEAAGGDQNLGSLAWLFSYWSNDVVSIAAHYGVGWLEDGTLSADLPPPPSPEHWWSEGRWMEPLGPFDSIASEVVK